MPIALPREVFEAYLGPRLTSAEAVIDLLARHHVSDVPHPGCTASEQTRRTLVLQQGKTKKGLSITACPQFRAATIVRDAGGSGSDKDFSGGFAAARDANPRLAKMTRSVKLTLQELRSFGAALFLAICRELVLVQALLGHGTRKQTLEYLRGHPLHLRR
ncbi:hypothetical protein [Nevskia ramosa]|uniref:hypothetical protein n=1 Tax=Nevskia ramosa TaxID=64002 RepID=UPI003D0E2ABE